MLKKNFWLKMSILYVAVGYAIIPFIRGPQTFLRENNLLRITLGLVVIAAVFVVLKQIRNYMSLNRNVIIVIVVFLSIFTGSFFSIQSYEERFHLVQYGALPVFLVCWLQTKNISQWANYSFAFLIAALAGLGDEGIQYLTPNRYFEWRDVAINAGASLWGTAFFMSLQFVEGTPKTQ